MMQMVGNCTVPRRATKGLRTLAYLHEEPKERIDLERLPLQTATGSPD